MIHKYILLYKRRCTHNIAHTNTVQLVSTFLALSNGQLPLFLLISIDAGCAAACNHTLFNLDIA